MDLCHFSARVISPLITELKSRVNGRLRAYVKLGMCNIYEIFNI
jgi:hypothetical protein